MPALELDAVDVSYGKVAALRGLSLHVEEGEIVAVLGNNGAGKSTTLSTISGLVRPQAGTVRYHGADLAGMSPWDIVAAGVVHVPEGRRLFSTMTVAENLQLGGYLVDDPKLVAKRMEHVYDLMPRVAERRNQQGGTLSGGEQQMVAIGRAIVAGPKLLMLDEPSMGLAPLVVQSVMEVIAGVNAEGTTVLLVEQNANAALKHSDRGYVLETGAVVFEGTAAEIANNPRVREAYLGE